MRFVLFLAAVLAVTIAYPEEKYTTKYDNVDLDDILNNERLLKKAFSCLMDESGCTPDIAELKKALPDALQTDCAKCSDKQKAGAKKVLKFIYEKKPDHFAKLEKKYDPEGIYRNKYKSLAEAEGVKV
ncbi:ejaculatory bulb-specific protein 3-like [Macrosteles quadrilineatus]|uniref:ejaculatory bulb-specific protein 3-like n=1 Tax=Macrosteles quadrilineatus TaxID=74068 RepID=UPI0023E228EF|nr:ejaculatory bulb-specific protein 3-like [Macrosteles quadrilineatus]